MAGAIETTPEVQGVLMSPRIPKRDKARMLAAALPNVPKEFVLFLQAVVKRGRQQLLRQIARSITRCWISSSTGSEPA